MLILASLLSIVLFTFHLADDIVRGFEPGRPANLSALLIFGVWLYGTLLLAGRRSGYVIVLLASLLGLGVPYLHFSGAAGVAGGRVAGTGGVLFWVWTLIALGVTSIFSLILAARGLWLGWRAR